MVQPSPVGTIIGSAAGALALLALAGAYAASKRHQRRLRRLKAEAAATPDFKIDVASGSLTSLAITSNPISKAASALGPSPPAGSLITEVPWADLVPDLRYAPMSGGFGTVFVARWAAKKRLVAVKVPKLTALSREQSRAAVQMLLAEAQGLARASDGGLNAHIVQVFGVAQGKAEGWAVAQQVSRDAEARRQARKARAQERRSKAAFSASVRSAASGGVQTWLDGDSTQGDTHLSNPSTGVASAGDASAATLVQSNEAGRRKLPGCESPGKNDEVEVEVDEDKEEEKEGEEEEEEEEEVCEAASARRAAEAAAALKLAAEASSSGVAPPAPFLFGLIMSFESGGSLDARLFPRRSGRAAWPLKMADKLRVLKEAASGLYGLHAVGMVHGDLKPENVLLSGTADAPAVRLADFGLAIIKSSASRQSRISTIAMAEEKRGTWPYMAPEMYRSKHAPAAAASRSTDIYAFGTLMHELLAARVPWREYTETDRISALLSGENLDPALLPKDAPPSVAALVTRCLAFDRAQRPRTAELLAVLEQAHENAVSGHFVSARLAPTLHRSAICAISDPSPCPPAPSHRTSSSPMHGARVPRASLWPMSFTLGCVPRVCACGRTTPRWALTCRPP